jgi:hypothetical protein
MILWATLYCFCVLVFELSFDCGFHVGMKEHVFSTIFRILSYWFFNMVLIVSSFQSLLVLFSNLVSCFESSWVSVVAFKLWFWVIDVFGFESNVCFESKWMAMIVFNFVFGFEAIMGANLFLVLNQNVWMWGFMECSCSLDIWILSLVDLASLYCWIVVGCTWILGMCMHLFLGHMDFESVRFC